MRTNRKRMEKWSRHWKRFMWMLVMTILLPGVCKIEGHAAETQTYVENGQAWSYMVNTEGQVTITGYTGAAQAVSVPVSIDGKQVTAIGAGAFSRCNSMQSITLPVSLTEIGANAFYSCTGLETVTIPAGITEIQSFTFSDCKRLKTVTFASGSQLEKIGYHAFYNCSLTAITIPEKVTEIGTDAFYGCSSMKIKVAANNSVYSSDAGGALYSKDKTTLLLCRYTGKAYTVADGVRTIGKQAFANNSILEEITFPDGLEMIESEAFYFCTSLQRMTLPDTVKKVDKKAFETHGYLPELYYPVSLDLSEACMPSDMLQISYLNKNDNTVSLTVQNLPAHLTRIILPANIWGRAISSLGYADGINSSKITIRCTNHFSESGEWEYNEKKHWFTTCSVCGLGGGVREAHNYVDGSQACRCGYVPFTITSCSEACEVTYGTECMLSVQTKATFEVEEIAYQWYRNGKIIQGATKPQYVVEKDTAAGEIAFYCVITSGDYSIQTKEIPVKVKKAGNPPSAPAGVMRVPYTDSRVGDVVLDGDWKWQDAYRGIALKLGIGVRVTAVYQGADKGNYENEKVSVTLIRELKQGTVIEDAASAAQYKVTKADRSNVEVQYVKSIRKEANAIVVPAMIETAGISCNVTSIGADAFKNNKKLTRVTIGAQVKTIGAQAFYGCQKLKTVTIGKNVTSIGNKAFYKCSALKKVTIPAKVSKIGKQAFYQCKKLSHITLNTTKLTKQNVGSKAFKKTAANVRIKVPAEKLAAYKKLLKTKGIGKKAKIYRL